MQLTLNKHKYGELTKTAAQLLADSKSSPQVFKMGNRCVIITTAKPQSVKSFRHKKLLKEDYPEQPIIQDLSEPLGLMRSRLEEECQFVNYKGAPELCPEDILKTIPYIYDINWRYLTGIIEHPYYNDQFELQQSQGYDEETGLYSVLHPKLKVSLMPPQEAYDYLVNTVLDEFPFAEEIDKVVAVSALMTAIQRPYISGENGFPGYAVTSPRQSSGKTTLAKLISYSIFNRPIAATSWSTDEEEMSKHLLSILMEGHNCVLFDDLEQGCEVKSNELSRIMTSDTYSKRVLGKNKTTTVSTGVLWLMTGNNIKFLNDFATRILQIRLMPPLECPEERVFTRKDIANWALDNRKKIVSAVLSLVLHGKDLANKTGKESRFKGWDSYVRLPLYDLTNIDILDAFQNNKADDEDTQNIGALFHFLYEQFNEKSFKTSQIFSVFYESFDGSVDESRLREAQMLVSAAFGEKALNSNQALGRKFSAVKDYIVNGLQLKRIEVRSRIYEWRIVRV
ncbi:MAG: hypothetical protein OMM_00550 [Candidatus Magnetoglobus multicellularis str. Araruama]|uniref:DUF927 domain-containing protein n=1 Tax=Candidatus Magnetoglobus multicellularis str. Araruama TaxID=890399 RepID=A0A1V1PGP7_9BACT|nr:MAG: hypothetical protein OMM_00550 [Candidatus Magnetoglobus multicellularis str. Araruama]